MEPNLHSQFLQGIAIFLLAIAASAAILFAFYTLTVAAEPVIELYKAELSSYRPGFIPRN